MKPFIVLVATLLLQAVMADNEAADTSIIPDANDNQDIVIPTPSLPDEDRPMTEEEQILLMHEIFAGARGLFQGFKRGFYKS